MSIIAILIMLLSGSAHLEPSIVYEVQPEHVVCEISDHNLYAYDAVNPQISQGDSVTLVVSNTGEILAAW